MGTSSDNGSGIVVVGASAGGVETLLKVVAGLPEDLPAAVCVVLHLPSSAESALPQILTRAGPLPAVSARDGEKLAPGKIYVAPPDRHLLVEEDCVRVVRGPRENNHRPAIDPLFRSAALAWGSEVVGVILSGSLDDGAAGLRAITMRGGAGIVQDPADARYPDMPRSAIRADDPNYVVPAGEIASLIGRLASETRERRESLVNDLESEVRYAELNMETVENEEVPGRVVPLSCPECNGTLWELEDGKLVRFRCRVGHAFSPESLEEAQENGLDVALWTALRALEERAALSRRLVNRLTGDVLARQRVRYERRAREAEEHARTIKDVLFSRAAPEETPT